MWILCEGNCFDKVKGIQHFILLYQEPVGHFRPQPSVIEIMLFKFNERNNPSSSLKKTFASRIFSSENDLERSSFFISVCDYSLKHVQALTKWCTELRSMSCTLNSFCSNIRRQSVLYIQLSVTNAVKMASLEKR